MMEMMLFSSDESNVYNFQPTDMIMILIFMLKILFIFSIIMYYGDSGSINDGFDSCVDIIYVSFMDRLGRQVHALRLNERNGASR